MTHANRADDALLQAINVCDVSAMGRLLVSRRDVVALDRDTPGGLIQIALRSKGVARMHAISLLARRGARVGVHNDFGVSPVFEVLTSTMDNATERLRALSALLSAGADANECIQEEHVEASDVGGHTLTEHTSGLTAALCIAAQVGDAAAMELLLDAKAHPDAPQSLVSPLRVALRNRQMVCATTLLVRGASASRIDGEGLPPAASARDLEALMLLEAGGAKVDQRVGSRRETLLQAWCATAPDDVLLRHLAGRYPSQIWERDSGDDHAISKLWRRWSIRRDDWIPKLIADWESDLFQGAPEAYGKRLPQRL